MAEFYNISTWQEKPHFQTGGTRNKIIVENPEDGIYIISKHPLNVRMMNTKMNFGPKLLPLK
jgi:hypothetical protein